MLNYLAKFISLIFHPLLMSSIGLLFIFNSGTYLSYLPLDTKRALFILVFIGTFLIPICFLPFYIYLKLIDDIKIESRIKRFYPLFVTGILYLITYLFLRNFPVPFIRLFLLSSTVCVFVNAFASTGLKISSHLIGTGGLVGLVAGLLIRLNADVTGLLIISILISGSVGYSRLQLKAHSPFEVYGGFVVGLFVVCGILLIF